MKTSDLPLPSMFGPQSHGGAGPAVDLPEEPPSEGLRHHVQTCGARRRQAQVSVRSGTAAVRDLQPGGPEKVRSRLK